MTTYRTTIINGRPLRISPHLRPNPTDKGNPSPQVLPPQARALWDATYQNANSYYNGAWDLADMTAWRAVKMRYPQGAGNWRPRTRNPTAPPISSTVVPDPGRMITLGRLLEYVVEENPPRIDVYRFKNDHRAPKVLWSPSQKMLLVLPQDHISTDMNADLEGLEDVQDLYADWSWGQDPRGFVTHPVDDYKINPLGMADTIVYRSGKGTEVRDDPIGVQEYIHQFGDSVVAYQGPNTRRPKAIVFRGGDLDVKMPGIVN